MERDNYSEPAQAGRKESRRQYNQRRRRDQAWQRLMSFVFFIPAFFSLLTFYIAFQDGEYKAAIVFAVLTILSGAGGIIFWTGNISLITRVVDRSRSFHD